ncbi:MAG: hypothetical protein IKZ12_04190 [Alistipes sp.]|nr:hypothetical protein [Alistipes sp.]
MNYFEKLNGGGYAAPTLEVLDIAVEQGFASSPIGDLEGGDIIGGEWDNAI